MKKLVCTILLMTLLLVSCASNSESVDETLSVTTAIGTDTVPSTDMVTEPTTEPEPEPVLIPELPIYKKGDLNSEVLPALFEGKASFTDVTDGIGSAFRMHFGDFLKVGNEIWS